MFVQNYVPQMQWLGAIPHRNFYHIRLNLVAAGNEEMTTLLK